MPGSRGGGGGAGGPDRPPEKSQKWSGSLENKKTFKPAFNVGPSSARQQKRHLNGVSPFKCLFCWRADDGPLIVVFGSSLPSSNQKKKKKVKVGPLLTKLSGSAHGLHCLTVG